MSALNEIVCTFGMTNTGEGTQCNYIPSPEVYDVLMPKGTRITATMAANWKSTLSAALINDDPLLRWFATGRYSATENTGEAENVESFDDGTMNITRDPTTVKLRTITRGNGCTHINLLGFDRTHDRFDTLFVDKNDIFLGQKAANATTSLFEVAGNDPYLISAKDMAEVTFTASPRYQIAFAFDDRKYMQKNRAIIDASNLGIRQVLSQMRVSSVNVLSAATATVNGTQAIYLMSSCGNQNLGKIFGSVLNSGSMYKVTNAVTGATISVTSATINAATGAITLALTSPPTTGTLVNITLASVSVLAAAGMKYFEGIPLQVAMF